MRVQLRNNWFAPDGTLYYQRDSPHLFSDDWKDKLPQSAVILDVPAEEEEEDTAKKPESKK